MALTIKNNKGKYRLQLDVVIDIDLPKDTPEWQLNEKYLKQTILNEYFYKNGTDLNQDIQIANE